MHPVRQVSGTAYPWGAKNVDTDVIIPAHWLKTTTREGSRQRRVRDGAWRSPATSSTIPAYTGAPILIAGDNFGCGSSREHAAWALADLGIQAVIAPSFSDIFSGNAFKNGIVPVVLPQEAIDRLLEVAKTDPVTVDLETMTVTTPFQDRFPFRARRVPPAMPDGRAGRDRPDAGKGYPDFEIRSTRSPPSARG